VLGNRIKIKDVYVVPKTFKLLLSMKSLS
jgi:hypothetical protein